MKNMFDRQTGLFRSIRDEGGGGRECAERGHALCVRVDPVQYAAVVIARLCEELVELRSALFRRQRCQLLTVQRFRQLRKIPPALLQ